MQTPAPPNFDISKTSALVCKGCGNHTFTAGVFLRKVSKLVSPNGQDGILPIPTFVCNACGVPPDEAVPSFIKMEPQNNESKVTKSHLSLLKD